jgi:hypothetical protein
MKMKFFIPLIFFMLIPRMSLANTPYGGVPLQSAAGVGISDSFDYTDQTGHNTFRLLLSDIVNIPAVSAAFTSKLSLSGGTLTGPLILQADPVTALGAATKQYVDAHGGGGGGGPRTTHVASSNFTIPTLTVDYLLNMDLTSGSLIAQLPDAVASNGYCADVKTTGSTSNSVTMASTSAQTIDTLSAGSWILKNESKHFCAIGGNWSNY